MSDSQAMLILAEADAAADLAARLDANANCCPDPYDGLLQMSRRHWPVVLIAAEAGKFESLARASRRLQGLSKIFAICSPADEPDALSLTGDVIDDYFIGPLTPADVKNIKRSTLAGPASSGAGSSAISTDALASLIESASTQASLEDKLAGMVNRILDAEVQWLPTDELPPGRRPLLLIAADTPRVLAGSGRDVTLDPPAEEMLAELQQLAPALLAVASRTESLHKLAITDHLTQAYNRRYFYAIVDRILAESARRGKLATLLLYDIDNFKRYNDTYGHAAGDEILRETASLMRKITRNHDIIARIGGDEFAVLFWEPDKPRKPDSRPPEAAAVLADRFRQAIRTHEFPSLGPEATGALTISGGLAAFPEAGRTCRELLRAADAALKSVKTTGKDAISLIGDDEN